MRDYSKPMSFISLGEGYEIKGNDELDKDKLGWKLLEALMASHEPSGVTGLPWDYSEATRLGEKVLAQFRSVINVNQGKTANAITLLKLAAVSIAQSGAEVLDQRKGSPGDRLEDKIVRALNDYPFYENDADFSAKMFRAKEKGELRSISKVIDNHIDEGDR